MEFDSLNKEEMYPCSECGEMHTIEEVEFVDDEYVCHDCLENSGKYEWCPNCEEWHNADDMVRINRGRRFDSIYWCRECVDSDYDIYWCNDCEEYYDRHYISDYERHDGITICGLCYDDNYGTCYDCDEIFHNDDLYWNDDIGEYLCEHCQDERERNRGEIHDYGYKPKPIFKDVNIHDRFISAYEIENLTLGVELEIDKGHDTRDCSEELVEASEDIYCKHDGSLSNGIEIVSHPCTLEYHLKEFAWGDIIHVAHKYEFLSHDARTCGLHVHVGRRQLGKNREDIDATIAKVMVLMNTHWNNLVKFSRRKENQLDRWAKKPEFDYSSNEETLIRNALATSRNGRYQALNLRNSDTIEFRMFNGTLRKETLFATLQMVSNICMYAKNHSFEEVHESKWNDIVEETHYDELVSYIRNRDINPEDREELMSIHDKYIGKLVRVNDTWQFELDGAIGRIEYVEGENFGINFIGLNTNETMRRIANCLHNLSGRLSTGTGRWLYRNEFEFIEEEM